MLQKLSVMKVRVVVFGLLAVVLALAGCAGPTPTAPAAQPAATTVPATATPMPTAEEMAGTTVALAENDALGQFLADADGMTLYLFEKDTSNTSACYDQCAENWPPLLTEGEPVAGDGVDASLLGTTERDDGSMQITYNGWPLYYFAGDQAAGDTNGQEVGDVWYVLSPAGEKVAAEEMAGTTVALAENDTLGQFLADADGMTLYLFEKDTPNTSACYDQCAENWPPLLTEGDPVAGDGVDASLLGTTERDDGSLQVTYNRWPLYYFAGDQAAGDTNGQEVGDVWYVLSPAGEKVAAEQMAGTTVALAENDALGQFLADADGMTLYLFEKDTPNTSACYDQCAENWPPLLTEGEPMAGDGVDAALLGTTERDDGSMQITYNGWPLYYFAGDQAAGDTNGQEVGDVWYVLSPAGEKVAAEEMAGTTVALAENDALGQFLADADGMTLYLFEKDSPNTSACYDQCAENWPPLLTEGDPVAGDGVDAALLGTTERDDGSTQVTYNGWPLYHFAGDQAAGDTNGQEVGDVWYVLSPAGEKVGGEGM